MTPSALPTLDREISALFQHQLLSVRQAFVDSRALYDSITSTSATGSKEVRACIADLRDHYRLGTLASITWLSGSLQLADGLTNPNGAGTLRAAAASGWVPLPRSACVTKSASGRYGSQC